MDYKKRIEKVQEFIERKRGNCFLIFRPSDIFYLTGINGIEGIFLIANKTFDLFVSEMYYHQSLDSLGYNKIEIHIYNEGDFFSCLSTYKKVLYSSSEISHLWYIKATRMTKCKLKPVENIVAESRTVKEEGEIELIKKAKEIAEKTLSEISELLKKEKKLTELDLVAEIKYRLIKNGADRESFEPIVASGIYSSYPHHKSKNKVIKKGEVIVIDLGAEFCGYKSDLTATFFYGRVSDEVKKIYNIVKDAQSICIDFIHKEREKGKKIKGKDVHKKAVSFFKKYKLEKYFIHSLGHGVGIDVHEKPYLSPLSKDIIEKKSVFTIEPGIYIPGKFGIRIEDTFLL